MFAPKGEGFGISLRTKTISKSRAVVHNLLSEWDERQPPDDIVKTYPVIRFTKGANIIGEIPLIPTLVTGAGLIGAALFALLR